MLLRAEIPGAGPGGRMNAEDGLAAGRHPRRSLRKLGPGRMYLAMPSRL